MTAVVLDASALLAWLRSEPGAHLVDRHLEGAMVSAVNWSEVLQKAVQRAQDPGKTALLLRSLGLRVSPLTLEDAEAAAVMWPVVRAAGLSLADRCCLALAARLSARALTADRAWKNLPVGVPVTIIR